MGLYLGIDTSNYTTSAAIYDSNNDIIIQKKRLLSVKHGHKGLRQSEALFQHVKNLPDIMEELFKEKYGEINAIGYSSRPRSIENSYMPCFLAGKEAAVSIAAAAGIKCLDFSHQEGHIAAALYSAGKLEIIREPFIAFHVSGGTTDAVIVKPGTDSGFDITPAATSLDLNAGQLIDRVGVMMGLDFPAGPELEKMALKAKTVKKINVCLKGMDCCLSGAENICEGMNAEKKDPDDIARFCIEFIKSTLDGMVSCMIEKYGKMPIVFAGGVMSNSIIRNYMIGKYGTFFAKPAFSCDNAAGVAVLAKLRTEGL